MISSQARSRHNGDLPPILTHLLVHWQIICRDRISLRLYHRAGSCRLGPQGQAGTNHYTDQRWLPGRSEHRRMITKVLWDSMGGVWDHQWPGQAGLCFVWSLSHNVEFLYLRPVLCILAGLTHGHYDYFCLSRARLSPAFSSCFRVSLLTRLTLPLGLGPPVCHVCLLWIVPVAVRAGHTQVLVFPACVTESLVTALPSSSTGLPGGPSVPACCQSLTSPTILHDYGGSPSNLKNSSG